MSDVNIIRHKKITGAANPFDPEWNDYFQERETYKMLLSLKGRRSLLYIWNKQNRICPVCNTPITKDTQWNVREKAQNGKTIKFLVHDKCYKHNRYYVD